MAAMDSGSSVLGAVKDARELAPPEGGGLRPSWTAPPRATRGALMGRRAALGLHRPMRLAPIAINHLAFPISERARALRCSHHQGRLLTLVDDKISRRSDDHGQRFDGQLDELYQRRTLAERARSRADKIAQLSAARGYLNNFNQRGGNSPHSS
jgi:hypothetical protein